MIIECEECKSKFNLDESLLKEEGSKVRCSLCKHVFTAYPPDSGPMEEDAAPQVPHGELEETVALDSPPVFDDEEPGFSIEAEDADLEPALEEPVEEPFQAVSPDEIPDLEEEKADTEEAADRAPEIVEEAVEEDIEKKTEQEAKEAAEAPSEEKPARSKALPIFLLILVLLAGGFVAVTKYAPNLLPGFLSFLKPAAEQEVVDIGVRGLSIMERSLSGQFIESTEAGSLFVIKGSVVNEYPKSRSFILIKGSILDNKGKPVNTKRAYAGNTFVEDQIKNMSIEEIDKELKNKFGNGRSNFDIKPGEAVPFMIIFENLPEDPDIMSEYTVEPVSSSPGTY